MRSIAIIGNVASLGYLIGKELRGRGYEVEHYCTYNVFTTMPEHKYIVQYTKTLNVPFERTMKKIWLQHRKSYDIEIRLSADKYVTAKNSVMVFNGSELRDGAMKPEARCFVTTKDLVKYVQGCDARLLPRCIDTDIFRSKRREPWKEDEELVVGHFPTDKMIKGTNLVLEAVQHLKSLGHNCTVVSEVVPHEEMPRYLADIDVLCDWFRDGIYGIVSIEALAMGTPVVCHVKEEYFDYPMMKPLIKNCELTPQSLANAILDAAKCNIDSSKVVEMYSPKRTVDILLEVLQEWKML
jgi:glycosyltransferase involved in cell wall biosynthesis